MKKTFAFVCLATLVGASGASAGCYDVFGCTNQNRIRLGDLLSGPNCQFLYEMRNGIYKEHGYCFHTPRAQSMFGNQGCVTGNAEALGLNQAERYNASVILQAEHTKGCPE